MTYSFPGSRHIRSDMLDGLAVCASTLCMIHCLVLPLLLAALPALAARFTSGEAFHSIVLTFAVPTSALALIGGWRMHRATAPVIAGAGGLILMALGVVLARSEAAETAITVTGSLFLAGAHIANWRYRRPRSPVA